MAHLSYRRGMALDRITKSLLEDFAASESLSQMGEPEAFERFATFAAISREHPETFNVEDLIVAGGNDLAIDGLAIIANGGLVTSLDEFEDLLEASGYIEATFVFVQAKTATSFDSGEIGNFCAGVRDFFAEEPTLPRNDAIKRPRRSSAIYDNSARFRRGNPHCRLYYVTAGRWTDDAHLTGRVSTEVQSPRSARALRAGRGGVPARRCGSPANSVPRHPAPGFKRVPVPDSDGAA